ncbi:hypothetical protein P5F48_05365 [Clostridium perfringens]|uniref:hypothetical protein n=1 Tax=Clostridium TaxID=1485 RepID=UPI001D9F3A52|nr:hypothetical protein [Clostridium sp.]EGT0691774.1 hypothetical protein [Clostridium perfringens]MDK0744174.1 hypothetical protein [Clostridium perfringens]MDK0753863.1 hypothetical protein [Clostridium perfringens]MDK0757030.1 hypothetical protein [Clostridium perfringens]MDK0782036.1 hypothetical protein [Clostridium perfringens]
MRKTLSLLIAIGILSSSFIACGTSSKDITNNESKINNSSNINKDKEESNNETSNKEKDKNSNDLDIFLNGGVLEGNINDNIGVVINLENSYKKDDCIIATEYYTKYPDQSLDVDIKSDGNNKYTINESENGKSTGIYKVTIEGNTVKGTFTNTSTNVKSNVDLEFKKESNEKKVNNDNNIENKNNSEEKKDNTKTIGFLRDTAINKGLLNGEIAHLTNEQVKNIGNGNPKISKEFEGQNVVVARLEENLEDTLGKFYVSAASNNAKLAKEDYLIDGKKAWITTIAEASIYLSGSKEGNNFAIIEEDGKVCNYKDLYDAAKNDELKQINIKNGQYRTVSSEEIAYDYNSPFWINSTGSLITSEDNPDPDGWQPPRVLEWPPQK